jgi:outer membrane protein OmpA-like peptidoglycan-associated protein
MVAHAVLAGFLVPLGLSEGGDARPRGAAAASLTLGAAADPLVVRDESGRARGGVDRVVMGELGLRMGLGWHLEAVARVMGEARTVRMDEGMTGPDEGMGEARMGARAVPFGGPIAIEAVVGAVSGDTDVEATARRSLGRRVVLALSAGYRVRDREVLYDAVSDDAVSWGGAAELAVLPQTWLATELRGEVGLAGSASPAEWLAGLRWAIGDAGVGVYAGTGIGDAPGSPTWRVQVAATFAPRGTRERRPRRLATSTPVVERAVPELDLDSLIEEERLDLEDEATPNVKVVDSEILLGRAVYFATNRKRVRSAFRPILDELAVFLERHPELAQVTVEGHADWTGSAEWNHALSLLRADAVCRYLVARGISPVRFQVVPYGASRSWVDNHTDEGRSRNRRVVFTVTQVSP